MPESISFREFTDRRIWMNLHQDVNHNTIYIMGWRQAQVVQHEWRYPATSYTRLCHCMRQCGWMLARVRACTHSAYCMGCTGKYNANWLYSPVAEDCVCCVCVCMSSCFILIWYIISQLIQYARCFGSFHLQNAHNIHATIGLTWPPYTNTNNFQIETY